MFLGALHGNELLERLPFYPFLSKVFILEHNAIICAGIQKRTPLLWVSLHDICIHKKCMKTW